MYLPRQISWSKEEKRIRREVYEAGIYQPERLAPWVDRLVTLFVPLVGSLFVLVPMYIMALQQDLTTNLITTTVAVVLLVVVCSGVFALAKDQTFLVMVGYAAVLMVFVGLTSSPQQLSG